MSKKMVTIQECSKQVVEPGGSKNPEIPSERFGKQEEGISYKHLNLCVCVFMYVY